MRIMHLVLKPRFSGAEILARDLCIAQRILGYPVAFSSINPPESSFAPQLEILKAHDVTIQTPAQQPSRISRLSWIRKAISQFQPSVVFAHSVIPAAYARISDLPNRRIITVLHATDNYPVGSPHRYAERVLCLLSKDTIAVSQEAALNYEKCFGRLPHVILNGLDLSQAEIAAQKRQNNTKESGIILQVGRVLPLKGQHITIKAMAEVVQQRPDVKLWLAGLIEDSSYYEELTTLIQKLDLNAHVRFLGPRPDIYNLLSQADVYVMPSSAESQGLAMLEALATGIPIVASKIDTLEQFAHLSGVQCVSRERTSDWAASILYALNEERYSYRDISNFDVKNTANRYIQTASQ